MIINDGTSQNIRSHHLVDDESFKVDELSFYDLVCYTKDFAQHIKYYNTDNEFDGFWDELIISDDIVIVSEILTLNIKKYEAEYLDNYNNVFDNYAQYLQKQIDLILELAEYFNRWYVQLYNIEVFESGGLDKELDFLIRNKLSHGFLYCKELSGRIKKQSAEDKQRFEAFHSIWYASQKNHEIESLKEVDEELKNIFYRYNNSLYYLKRSADKYYEPSMFNKSHAPFISMLFTFIKLLRGASDHLNSFTKEYVRFYYKDVLAIKPQKYQPDSAFLLFELKKGIEDFRITKGTGFIGGKDETNKKIIYTADRDIVINKARIGKLLTLYLEKNVLIWPKVDCTNILRDEIPVIGSDAKESSDSGKWPLFGGPYNKPGEFAEIGFALCDNTLLLIEGKRELEVDISFTSKSFSTFQNQLDSIKEDYSIGEVFIMLFSKMFKLSLTTDEDWHTIEDYYISCSLLSDTLPENTIRVQFQLSVDDPAVGVYQKEVHGQGFELAQPVLSFIINNESYLFPYSLINDLELEKMTCRAQVSEVKNIALVNELGKVDITQPFNLLGVQPRVNSYFILGNYEISQKKIKDLSLTFKWNNLPHNENGLIEYFREYGVDISKNEYTCNISFLNNGDWLPKEKQNQQTVKLFVNEEDDEDSLKEKLTTSVKFDSIDTLYYQLDNRKIESKKFSYNNFALGGFIKFSFTNPRFAFGHESYPQVLSTISLENAKRKAQRPLPNKPFSPLVENMSLGYTSESSLDFSSGKSVTKAHTKGFYHLHPWGYEEMLHNTRHKKKKLFPEYKAQGNLFIGLEEVKPNMTVSLFFNLLDDSLPEEEEAPPLIKWEYLTSNTWKPLPTANLISDSTHSFIESGIVELLIPADINQQNTILSEDYYWIKVSAKDRLESVCSILSASTQAMRVTWKNQENSLSHLDAALPSLSIAKSESGMSGIKSIIQVTNSFNGKPEETLKHTRMRVAERLKHKNRAVTPWDYEILVLEKFPEIYKVKCLPHMSSKKPVDPGTVLITVIKKVEKENMRLNFEPMVNNATLHKIKNFLAELAPGFVKIEVRNPVFERIHVRCAVKIKMGLDAGYFIALLNKELKDYLTPWQSEGNEPGFGKEIKCSDVLSFVQNLDFIEFATDFSVLQITHDKRVKYSLLDTADRSYKQQLSDPNFDVNTISNNKVLRPSFPWGVLVSADKHTIEIIDRIKQIEPVKTGIDELEVGDTFVVK